MSLEKTFCVGDKVKHRDGRKYIEGVITSISLRKVPGWSYYVYFVEYKNRQDRICNQYFLGCDLKKA